MKIRVNILYGFFVMVAIGIGSCNEQKANKPPVLPRDTAITNENAFSGLYLDSLQLEQFIGDEAMPDSVAAFMRNFYNSRNFHLAWFTEEGFTESALAFWNLYNNYIKYAQDSAIIDKQLDQQMDMLLNDDTSFVAGNSKITRLELQLTEHFYQYAQYAYGGRIDPWELQWHIPKKKIDALALLDSIIAHEGRNLEELEPLNASYKMLKKELLRYYTIEEGGGWEMLSMERKRYKQGDSSSFIAQVKKRLSITGDYSGDTSDLFTIQLAGAVETAQKRFGLTADGVVRNSLVQKLNVPVKKRIEQMLINLERMRWLPREQTGNHILANIPEFKLHVFENGKQVFDMKIIVGQAARRTVVFTGKLQYIVFSPYWNIPRSIVRNEILPAIDRDPDYLKKHNMEQIGFGNGLPVIRQKPGAGNALGRVKFLFPNRYSIYFHDTPAKTLFKRQKRAFSHGCVRLAAPQKLAEYLLRKNREWTPEKIQKAMYAGRETWVTLANPVSVALLYFTAWVDNEGLLNFRKDVYGHDKKMADHLFGAS